MYESNLGNGPRPLGTLENPIVDSQMTLAEALRENLAFPLPREIYEKQMLIRVMYLSFDGKYHKGQIVVDKDLEQEVKDFFEFLLKQNFPLRTAIPIAHEEKFNFDDKKSMAANNSSGFNPRNIDGTDRPSNHAFGRAIDINPFQNPWQRENRTEPLGAVYDPKQPGTFTIDSPLVQFLKNRGWIWGGEFIESKDYHHFEKPLEKNK